MNNDRMKFYCDTNRCISCFGCVTACKELHLIPVGINRRRVITIDEGIEGKETSVSLSCMHCTDAPCAQVCPVNCFYIREDGIVLHNKEECIGCGYCLFACPFGAPQFPKTDIFGGRGIMDKCTMCAGGPATGKKEYELYGANLMAAGVPPQCAAMCSTKALLVGESDELSTIIRERAVTRSMHGVSSDSGLNMWKVAYKDKV